VRVKGLIVLYTRCDEPVSRPVALTTEVHFVWLLALNHTSDTGNIEASEESLKLVSRLNYNEKKAWGGSTNLLRYAKQTLV